MRVAVIEGGTEVGGLCILRGCMPTKALLYAAEVRHLSEYGVVWGMNPTEAPFDWGAVMARKDRVIKEFAEYREEQLSSGQFEFIRASARFIDPRSVALSDGRTLTAKHFIISTGSVIAKPPLPQLSAVGYLTSDDALALKKLPKSVIVLGGGAVAAEFAQLFVRFDVQVALIQRSPHLLKEFDTDAVTVLESVFRREGITVYTGTALLDAYREGSHKVIAFLHEGRKTHVKADEVFFALGRQPNTAGLDLAKAAVATEGSRIVTNLHMQTSTPHIYAAGDCTGPYEIVHLAVQQGEIAAHNIAHSERPRKMDYRLRTEVLFTAPQVATVGLTESAAKERSIPHLAASYPFGDHGKSILMEARDGFVKLLAEPASGEILGGCCVGPLGGELIHEIVAAMAKRMTVHELAIMPHYHPTLAEIWTYPAEQLAAHISPPRDNAR